MERNMNREVETIREKVHTTADAALFLCFQEGFKYGEKVIRFAMVKVAN